MAKHSKLWVAVAFVLVVFLGFCVAVATGPHDPETTRGTGLIPTWDTALWLLRFLSGCVLVAVLSFAAQATWTARSGTSR